MFGRALLSVVRPSCSNCSVTLSSTRNITRTFFIATASRRFIASSRHLSTSAGDNSSSARHSPPIQHNVESAYSGYNSRFGRQVFHYWTASQRARARTIVFLIASFSVLVFGFAYLSVPLYRIFCSQYGTGSAGTFLGLSRDEDKIEDMDVRYDRKIKVRFAGSVGGALPWEFVPQVTDITVHPGETALVFFTASNLSKEPIIGISTYNVHPSDAGQYFNKIQCFCFDEQMLNAGEEVDMPVFFYLDPDFADDPYLKHCEEILLSYTFFQSVEGLELPRPEYAVGHTHLDRKGQNVTI